MSFKYDDFGVLYAWIVNNRMSYIAIQPDPDGKSINIITSDTIGSLYVMAALCKLESIGVWKQFIK